MCVHVRAQAGNFSTILAGEAVAFSERLPFMDARAHPPASPHAALQRVYALFAAPLRQFMLAPGPTAAGWGAALTNAFAAAAGGPDLWTNLDQQGVRELRMHLWLFVWHEVIVAKRKAAGDARAFLAALLQLLLGAHPGLDRLFRC